MTNRESPGEALSKTTYRKFLVLSALARMGEATTSELVNATGISPTALRRQLETLQNDYQVQIRLTQPLRRQQGEQCSYVLTEWGVFDKEAFMKAFGELRPNPAILDARQTPVRSVSE